MWKCVGTDKGVQDVAYTTDQIKHMYATGDTPWSGLGVGSAMYFGKLCHRITSDIARCEEELLILPIERRRLRTWVDGRILAVDNMLVTTRVGFPSPPCEEIVEAHVRGQFGSGKDIFLMRHRATFQSMKARLG